MTRAAGGTAATPLSAAAGPVGVLLAALVRAAVELAILATVLQAAVLRHPLAVALVPHVTRLVQAACRPRGPRERRGGVAVQDAARVRAPRVLPEVVAEVAIALQIRARAESVRICEALMTVARSGDLQQRSRVLARGSVTGGACLGLLRRQGHSRDGPIEPATHERQHRGRHHTAGNGAGKGAVGAWARAGAPRDLEEGAT
mmetsp:Transcript_9449/g.27127  ORF Transcript_9449/g.27127 Transcript_9449/m.27127 type:complete len:202 (+) Transcript_9449:54-659(+)